MMGFTEGNQVIFIESFIEICSERLYVMNRKFSSVQWLVSSRKIIEAGYTEIAVSFLDSFSFLLPGIRVSEFIYFVFDNIIFFGLHRTYIPFIVDTSAITA